MKISCLGALMAFLAKLGRTKLAARSSGLYVEAELVAVLGAELPHRPPHLHLIPAAHQEPDLTWE